MARTPKDTVDYFPHDAHASAESNTLAVLEGHFGNDGYAFWFKLLEKLASTDGHSLDCSDSRRLQVFCGKAHITEDKGVEMLNLLVEMDTIDRELWETNRVIWCQNLVDNLADVYRNRRREMPLKPLSTPNKLLTTCRNPITTPGKAIFIDERKGKEIKGEDTKEVASINSPDIETVLDVFRENICEPSEDIENDIIQAVKRFSSDWVIDAIKEAVMLNKRAWYYIAGILKNWECYGKGAKFPRKRNSYGNHDLPKGVGILNAPGTSVTPRPMLRRC